jgi:hypothetical protein
MNPSDERLEREQDERNRADGVLDADDTGMVRNEKFLTDVETAGIAGPEGDAIDDDALSPR